MNLNVPRIITFHANATGVMADQCLFVCEAGAEYEVEEVIEVHGVAAGAACTLDVKRSTGTTAPSGGTSILSSTFDLESTANTPVYKNRASGLAAARRLVAGDRLCADFTGTSTAVVGLTLHVVLKQLRKSTYRA